MKRCRKFWGKGKGGFRSLLDRRLGHESFWWIECFLWVLWFDWLIYRDSFILKLHTRLFWKWEVWTAVLESSAVKCSDCLPRVLWWMFWYFWLIFQPIILNHSDLNINLLFHHRNCFHFMFLSVHELKHVIQHLQELLWCYIPSRCQSLSVYLCKFHPLWDNGLLSLILQGDHHIGFSRLELNHVNFFWSKIVYDRECRTLKVFQVWAL